MPYRTRSRGSKACTPPGAHPALNLTCSVRSGDKDGYVTQAAIHATVDRYRDYLKEQDYIDKAFRSAVRGP